ncbi:MAG: helix-turn-helix domain-containing protein [bacterium]
MESFGTYLKQERERQNISLDEVTEATRISRHIINAIEEDRQDQLPPLPFLKGFIRSYSLYLGLDPVETTAQYIHSLPSIEDNFNQDKTVRVDFYVNKPLVLLLKKNKHRAFIFGYILLMITLLVVSFLWFQTEIFNIKKPSHTALLPHDRPHEALIDSNKESLMSDDYEEAPIGQSLSHPENERKESIDAHITEYDYGSFSDEPVIEDKKLLVIRAKEITWIDIQIDDEEPFDIILPAGGVKKLEAKTGFNLLIGNAAGIELDYEGTPVGSLGDPNQVVRIKLPPL